MAAFRLSRRAEQDLQEIADFTRDHWGTKQCLIYLDALESCCQRLADLPSLGRACDDLRPGYFRMEHGRHVIFYRLVEGGVLVVRILHVRMLPKRHFEAMNSDPQDT